MSTREHGTLRVIGANLFYRRRGSGPLLVILSGGHGDADTTDELTAELVERYTVVTYDRRGLSRSSIDPGFDEHTIATHGDDLHCLLAALTAEPVLVFGSSIGALIGLDLVARHPDQVLRLVAHEPPAWELLPEAERHSATRAQVEVEATFRSAGVVPAFRKFMGLAEIDYEDRELDRPLAPPTPRTTANLAFFFAHDLPAVHVYRLELALLDSSQARLVVGYGESRPERALYRTSTALATRLGTALVAFPGGHTGWLLRPKAFAKRLHEVLR